MQESQWRRSEHSAQVFPMLTALKIKGVIQADSIMVAKT